MFNPAWVVRREPEERERLYLNCLKFSLFSSGQFFQNRTEIACCGKVCGTVCGIVCAVQVVQYWVWYGWWMLCSVTAAALLLRTLGVSEGVPSCQAINPSTGARGEKTNNMLTTLTEETNSMLTTLTEETWPCQDNNLSLNVIKTKEMIVDNRKRRTEHAPILNDGAAVEQVERFKFFGVMLTKLVLF